jgi:nucleoid DNA-binding protein
VTRKPKDRKRRGRPIGYGKSKKRGYDYIRFDRDPSLVKEFAEACQLDEKMAKDILIVFFDEIKRMLLEGNVVTFSNLGKFYIGASNMQDGYVNAEIDTKFAVPKFRASHGLRKMLSKICL